ncbi:MAG TPA: FAD-dependent oxidoreductase [Planktothrix sp.]|jgi:hypothetical protein
MAKSHARESTSYSIVDVQSVTASEPEKAIRRGLATRPDYTVDCDLLIAGGGMGGVAAALAATDQSGERKQIKVCLTEETDWIGGQMTAQGVSAFDENYLVEVSGANRSYQKLRTEIRDYYRENFKLTGDAANDPLLNPGDCWVSWLSFEPKVALALLYDELKPAIDSGRLAIYPRMKPIYARLTSGEIVGAGSRPSENADASNRIEAVGMLALDGSDKVWQFKPKLCIDATELGDILPLAKLPYSTGSDCRRDTDEAHAPVDGDPENLQDFTYPFVLEYRPGEKHVIDKPAQYDRYNEAGKFSFQGYKMFEQSVKPGPCGDDDAAGGNHGCYLPFWTYRRLLSSKQFDDAKVAHDVAMINWDSNDTRGENIIDEAVETQARRLALGKLISLGFLYWLQTEAPRDDGGKGYPELMLRTDVLGSADGLSKFPYIREARRARCLRLIKEGDIVAATNPGARAAAMPSPVGIGLYPVDIHGHQEVPGAGQASRPFQIPIEALLPSFHTNVFPACKNIGTTHITNGAYRLHPIEWAIGEASGVMCKMILDGTVELHSLKGQAGLRRVQWELIRRGVPLFWFDDVPTDHENFAAIQFLAVSGFMPAEAETLHFRPDEQITESERAAALEQLSLKHEPAGSMRQPQTRAQFAERLLPLALERLNLESAGKK